MVVALNSWGFGNEPLGEIMFVRASSIVLAGILVSSMALANGPDGVQPTPEVAVAEIGVATHLDSLISHAGIPDADAEPQHGNVYSIMTEALAVEFLAFDAVVRRRAVVLSWETAAEIDNEGFNLLRSTDPVGDLEVINAQLIPAEGGPGFGAVYKYVDKAVRPETTYYYVLEDVDTSGAVTLRGANACLYDPFDTSSKCGPLAVKVPEPWMRH